MRGKRSVSFFVLSSFFTTGRLELMSNLSQRGLERRLKRHFLKATHTFFVPCAPGFERVLETEINKLEHVVVESVERGGVTFNGPLDTVYHANLHLRTGHRVLLRIDEFLAQSYPALFDRVTRIPWELYLGFNQTYSLKVSAKTSRLRQHKNIAETVASGVEEVFKPLGLRATLQDDAPVEVHLRFYQDRCTLSLNTSGKHLHRRGYRTLTTEAPLRETLAAGLLLMSDSRSYDLVLDPMCGSGTFVIEAALLAQGRAPGLQRSFAFEHLSWFQPDKWARFKREAESEIMSAPVKLIGNDIDAASVEVAQANAARAGVEDTVTFTFQDALTLNIPAGQRSLLVSNLPYGERLGTKKETRELTRAFSQHLTEHFVGWDYAFVTRDPDILASPRLTVEDTLTFHNGGLNVTCVWGRVKEANA